MTQLQEILDPNLLATEVAEGWIRKQKHPDHPELSIFNYTEKTQFTRRWSLETRTCRGLIVNEETGKVLARPFPKIHNFDEPEAPRIVDDQLLYHWDNKWDGSLGIVYRLPTGKLAVATRGSFASDQAIKGTQMLHEHGLAAEVESAVDEGFTPLFEIIYPENRIVLDYGDDEFMADLGYVQIATGAFTPGEAVKGTRRSMYSLLMDLSRANSEGWVAWLSPTKAVKIKQSDYVELHRIVTGLSAKEVWRQLMAGTYDRFAMKLPDEFYRTVDDLRVELEGQFQGIKERALDLFHDLIEEEFTTRKAQAAWVFANVPKDLTGLVFSLLDGRDISEAVWKMIEPSGKFGLGNIDE